MALSATATDSRLILPGAELATATSRPSSKVRVALDSPLFCAGLAGNSVALPAGAPGCATVWGGGVFDSTPGTPIALPPAPLLCDCCWLSLRNTPCLS